MVPHPWSVVSRLEPQLRLQSGGSILYPIRPAASGLFQMRDGLWVLRSQARHHASTSFPVKGVSSSDGMCKILHLDRILFRILVLAKAPTHPVTIAVSSGRYQYSGVSEFGMFIPRRARFPETLLFLLPLELPFLCPIPSESRSQLAVTGKTIQQTGMCSQANNNSFNKRFVEMVPLSQGYGL